MSMGPDDALQAPDFKVYGKYVKNFRYAVDTLTNLKKGKLSTFVEEVIVITISRGHHHKVTTITSFATITPSAPSGLSPSRSG